MNEGKCCSSTAPKAPICDTAPTIADSLKFAACRLEEIDSTAERILDFLEVRNTGADACKTEINCMMDQSNYIADQTRIVADKLSLIGNLLGAFQG